MNLGAIWRQSREQFLWAVATLAAGLTVIAVTWGAGTPKLSPGDPGPWGLPLACGVLLTVCALAEVTRVWIVSRSVTEPTELAMARLTLGDWLTIGAIGLYCVLIPAVGFTIASLLLTPLLLYRCGATWSIFWSLLMGLGIVILIKLIFGKLFLVQMPDVW